MKKITLMILVNKFGNGGSNFLRACEEIPRVLMHNALVYLHRKVIKW